MHPDAPAQPPPTGIPGELPHRPSAADLAEVQHTLDEISERLSALWAAALVAGDFNDIDRLVEASHAVHRAAVALTADRWVGPDTSRGS
jgi:endonuclease/exonuclease/phosphatase (EEP) superfamily protein YafD